MQEKSSSSVRVFSVDRRRIEDAITRWAAEIRRTHPEIERIYWFGSFVHGAPTPGSDVDLCLVVSDSPKAYRDRSVDYRPELPFAIDLFVYTRDEFERLGKDNSPLVREIRGGRLL